MGGVRPLLTRPVWIVGHLLACSAVAGFVWCGFWQLRRLDEVRSFNAVVSSRLEQPPVDVGELGDADPEELRYRRVTATGTFASDDELLLSVRQQGGRPGHHLLTPLELDDGTSVVIDRGWVPLDAGQPPVAEAAPVTDEGAEVTVTGVVVPSVSSGSFSAGENASGTSIGQVDIPRLADRTGRDLAPFAVLSTDQSPLPPGSLPLFAPLPELDEGNHLSYAGQWFLFAMVVGVGYPVLIARTANARGAAEAEPAPGRREPAPTAHRS